MGSRSRSRSSSRSESRSRKKDSKRSKKKREKKSKKRKSKRRRHSSSDSSSSSSRSRSRSRSRDGKDKDSKDGKDSKDDKVARSQSRSKSKSKSARVEDRKKDKERSRSRSPSRSKDGKDRRRGRSKSPKDNTTNQTKDRGGGGAGGGGGGAGGSERGGGGDRGRDDRDRGRDERDHRERGGRDDVRRDDRRDDRGRRDGSRDRGGGGYSGDGGYGGGGGGRDGGCRDGGGRDGGRRDDARSRDTGYGGGGRPGGYDDYSRGRDSRDSMRGGAGGGMGMSMGGGSRGGGGYGRAADIGRPQGGSGFGRAADIGRNPRGTMGPTGPGRQVGGNDAPRVPHPHAPRREELAPKGDPEEDAANLVFYGAELDGSAVPCWASAAGRSAPETAANSLTPKPHWGAYPATVTGIGMEVMDFIAFMSPDAEELKARYAALQRLDVAAKGIWPESEAECFGSTRHKMPLFGSDLDMRIKTGGRNENIPECQGITQMGNEILNQAWALDCDPRTSGRVPMITYKDKASGLKCKVCVGNRMTVRGTSFFNSPMIPLSARFPVFKLLMHPLKCVFTQRGLEKSFAGGLGTFRVGMMLLNYLAMHAPASTQAPTNEMMGAIVVGFFRYYTGESPDNSPEAATWQKWPENFKFKGEFYVMGVQVDFGGCAMGEVAMVFKAGVRVLSAMPVSGTSRVTCLSRLINDGIIADAREGVREQAQHPDNAPPEGTTLPSMFEPEKRLTYSAAPVPTLPTLPANAQVFTDPMGMGPAGAAMAAMGVAGGAGLGSSVTGAGGDSWGATGGGGGGGGGGYGDAPAGANTGASTGAGAAVGADQPSPCITLKNMFDPAQMKTNEQMWVEINEDVRDECSKHGEILHMQVDAHSQGIVYVKFDSAAAAASARQTLNMRWFAGRLITCDFTPSHVYDAQFRL